MDYIPLVFYVVFGAVLFLIVRPQTEVLSNWHHTFDFSDLSAEDFYAAVKEGVKKREIPDVYISTVVHFEKKNILGGRRQYLRISRGEYVFDVCAAPFGNCYFVSYWFVEKTGFAKRMLYKIKAIADFMGLRRYYQIDTETVFRSAVHTSVMEAVDKIASPKGVRLSENERKLAPRLKAA